MPAGGIHLCVGKRVADKLNISKSMIYYVGVVSADSWRRSSSTKMGTHFLDSMDSVDYHYEEFFNKYCDYLDNEFVMGYLIHLITDKFWYSNELVASNIYEDDYYDLKKLCSCLVKHYNIPKLELPEGIDNPIEELDSSGIIHTIDYLNDVNYVSGESSKFDFAEVINCIELTSDFIVGEILRLHSLVSI